MATSDATGDGGRQARGHVVRRTVVGTLRRAMRRALRRATPVLLAAVPIAAVSNVPEESAGGGYYVYADVVEVTPHYGWHRIEEPVRECVEVAEPYSGRYPAHARARERYRDEHRRDGSETAAGLVGGLLGALVGHQFGGGDGKKALTVAGALIGSSVARGHVRRQRDGDRHEVEEARGYGSVRHCTETVRSRRVRGIQGYDVVYRYQGRTFNKWVDEHPGDAIRVHVAVEPLD